jgi:hypothetical protein
MGMSAGIVGGMNSPIAEIKCRLAAEVLHSFGEVLLQAMGTSMLPSLWPGDHLVIQFAEFKGVLLGDVVLYARGGRFFIHRVLEKSGPAGRRFLIVRGDAMAEADPPVGEGELLGKVVTIYRAGNLIEPERNLSAIRRVVAASICRWDFLRGLALRLHGWRARRASGCGFPA